MIAVPLGDKIRIVSESESDIAVINLITRGRVCSHGDSIGTDERGRRLATMTIGKWDGATDEEKAEEMWLDQRRIGTLEHILSAIPSCPAHGEGCIPYALEWIAKAKEAMAEAKT
jgi:hypothetical protein